MKNIFRDNVTILSNIAKLILKSPEKSLQNIWWIKIKFLPLHSLSERERLAEAGKRM